MDLRTMPIITLSIQHLQHNISIAMTEYVSKFDEQMQKSIEDFCDPQNIESIIKLEVNTVLDTIIKEEVKRWFVLGDGRVIIRKAVEKRLKENNTYTPLDVF